MNIEKIEIGRIGLDMLIINNREDRDQGMAALVETTNHKVTIMELIWIVNFRKPEMYTKTQKYLSHGTVEIRQWKTKVSTSKSLLPILKEKISI